MEYKYVGRWKVPSIKLFRLFYFIVIFALIVICVLTVIEDHYQFNLNL